MRDVIIRMSSDSTLDVECKDSGEIIISSKLTRLTIIPVDSVQETVDVSDTSVSISSHDSDTFTSTFTDEQITEAISKYAGNYSAPQIVKNFFPHVVNPKTVSSYSTKLRNILKKNGVYIRNQGESSKAAKKLRKRMIK